MNIQHNAMQPNERRLGKNGDTVSQAKCLNVHLFYILVSLE